MSKELKLSLHSSNEVPTCNPDVSQYIITNGAAYYNDVQAFFKDGQFSCFKGWDNGEWTEFKSEMYKYWAELPKDIQY